MKILSIITTIIIIGCVFCSSDEYFFDITLSNSIDQSSLPYGKLFSNSQLFFRFQKDTKPILIHLTLPQDVEKEDFKLEYHGFEKPPSEVDIHDALDDFTEIGLSDEVEYEGNGKEFTYIMDNEIPYITLSFTPFKDLTSFSILVENYGDNEDDDKEGKESIDDLKIYDVEYLTYYDINIEKTDNSYFMLNSTQEYTGEVIVNLIVPHGTEAFFYLIGFPLKTGKVEELYTLNETEVDQLVIENLETIKEGANDIYRYSFKLNEEKKYFIISIGIGTYIDNIKVYIEKKEEEEEQKEEEEEQKEEQTKTNIYNVTYSTEYQIDKEYLRKENMNPFSFILLSKNTHNGYIFVQFKVKKGVPKDFFDLLGFANKNLFDDEDVLNLDIKYKGTSEGDEYDIHEYNFKLDEELYFMIVVMIKNDLDYLSVYFPEPGTDSTEPDSTIPDPISHIYVYDLLFKTEYNFDKKEFPQEIISANDKFYFRMENNNLPNFLTIITNLDEEPEFEVYLRGFEKRPLDEEIYDEELHYHYNEVNLDQKILMNNKNIFSYNLNLPNNMNFPYFSILVIPKKNINFFAIYVYGLEYHFYEFEYGEKYHINTTYFMALNVFKPKERDNNGQYFLNLIVPHCDKEYTIIFAIFGDQLDNSESQKHNELNVHFIKKYEIEDSTKDLYHYSFTLDEENKYYMIGLQMVEKVDYLSYYFYFPKKQYEVQYSTEYDIDKKYLLNSSECFNTFLSTEPHIGDNYIKLKVQKDVEEDSFIFEGYGNKVYNGTNDTNAVSLNIKYKYIIPGDKYNILLYHFKSNENSTYFVINMVINNNTVDYLTILFSDKIGKNETRPDEPEEPENPEQSEEPKQSESKESDSSSSLSPIVLVVIIGVSVLVFLIILYFVCRKLGFLRKNDVTSKDIETVDQIIV